MKHLIVILILCCFILSSCTTTKILTSNVKPIEVEDLKLLEPFSYISVIKKGNRSQPDDSLSAISKQLVFKVLEKYKGQIPLTGEIIISDTAIKNNLEKEYELLILTADRTKNITNLKITPTLDEILEANKTRFGLLIVSTGFTREKGNYGKQVAKGAAIGVLTLGMYYQVPIKAYSTIYAMIVDSKENNVAFFRKSFLQDMEPLNETELTKQFKKIFDGYFWNSN